MKIEKFNIGIAMLLALVFVPLHNMSATILMVTISLFLMCEGD